MVKGQSSRRNELTKVGSIRGNRTVVFSCSVENKNNVPFRIRKEDFATRTNNKATWILNFSWPRLGDNFTTEGIGGL